jgi:hypothetical protein
VIQPQGNPHRYVASLCLDWKSLLVSLKQGKSFVSDSMRAGEEVKAALAENENLSLTTIAIDTLPLRKLQIERPCLKPQPPVFLRVKVRGDPQYF